QLDSNPRSLSEGKCWKGRTSRRGGSFFAGGTEGSNPSSSSGESANSWSRSRAPRLAVAMAALGELENEARALVDHRRSSASGRATRRNERGGNTMPSRDAN